MMKEFSTIKTLLIASGLVASLCSTPAHATPTLQIGAPGGPTEGMYADYQTTLTDPTEHDTAVTSGNTLYLAGLYQNKKNLNIGGQYSTTDPDGNPLDGEDYSFFDDTAINFYSHFDGHGAVLMATVLDGSLSSYDINDFQISVDGGAMQTAFYTREVYDFGSLLPAITKEHDPIKNQDYFFFDVGDFAQTEAIYNYADETQSGFLGEEKTITLSINGLDWVHFDLFALITDSHGNPHLVSSLDTNLEGNPNSKDLTWKDVPEPSVMLLFGTGIVCLAGVARRKSKK